MIQNAKTKVADLGIPKHQVWEELGYSAEQRDQMDDQLNDESLTALNRSQQVVMPTVAPSQGSSNVG